MSATSRRVSAEKSYQDDSQDAPSRRKLEDLFTREMQDDETRPEREDVEEADETEEQGHVDSALVSDTLLHQNGIQAVDGGAGEREGIAESELGVRLVGKGATILVVFARQVHRGYHDDAGHGSQDSDKLAERKGLDACPRQRSQEKGPDTYRISNAKLENDMMR